MATTFTTTIVAIYTAQQPNANYVVNAIWKVTGVDGVHTAYINDNTKFDSTQSNTFIPYDQLTEAMVISWIPASDILNAQACVQGQIDSKITPPVTPKNTPLPWAS
jgi:uridylate kinase